MESSQLSLSLCKVQYCFMCLDLIDMMDSKFQVDGKIFLYDDMQVDSQVSTVILSIRSQYSDHVLNSLAESLKERQYEVESSLKDKTTVNVRVFYNDCEVGSIDSHYVWLVANMTQQLYGEITEILKTNFGYFKQTLCRVPHTYKEESLSDGIFVKTVSGIMGLDGMIPHTVFLLYDGSTLAGKALVSYFNSEMAEYEPTVISIEIPMERSERSSMFLRYIEEKLKQYGFVKLWIREVQNESFWESANYQIDDGQGIKYLAEQAST